MSWRRCTTLHDWPVDILKASGTNWAIIGSLVETANLNGVNPHACPDYMPICRAVATIADHR